MDDFEAPTFSLGLDLESQRPSFALGFDDDEEEHENPASTSNQDHQIKLRPDIIDILESKPEPRDFEWQGSSPGPQVFPDKDDEDPQCCNEEPLPKLKRLKRGPPANDNKITAAIALCQTSGQGFDLGKTPIDCDDIEDFSSDDDFFREDCKTPRNPSVRPSSSAKLSLSRSKAVTTPSFETLNCRPSVSSIKNSSNINRSSVLKPALGKRIGPFGKIQQSKCDFSEEEEDDLVVKSSVPWNAGATKAKDNVTAKSLFGSQKMVEGTNHFEKKYSSQDMRKHFTSVQGPSLATPAFDEFCEEYVTFNKQTDTNVSAGKNGPVVDNSVPPAYHFFENADMRIQRLLRQRLPNFLPINSLMRGENLGAEQVEINYLGQFTATRGTNATSGLNFQSQVSKSTRKKSTTRTAGKRKKCDPDGTETGSWTTTGNRITKPVIPRDAGKRRVSAKGCASGHRTGFWFTDAGRKVYISEDGREMMGKAAYLQYRKDNGQRKSTKKREGDQKAKKKYKKCAAKKK